MATVAHDRGSMDGWMVHPRSPAASSGAPPFISSWLTQDESQAPRQYGRRNGQTNPAIALMLY